MKGSPRLVAALGLLWLGLTASVHLPRAEAQELLVVESSEQDGPAADKLESLLARPLRRVRSAAGVSALCPAPEVAYGLLLDSAHHAVQLLRCRDQTLLTRVIAASPDPPAPYVSAYVATELLALGMDVDERALRAARRARLRLRAAGEVLVGAGLYSGSVRPNLTLGLEFQPLPYNVRLFADLGAAPFATAKRTFTQGRLELLRNDALLRMGAAFPLQSLRIEAFAQLLCAVTSASLQSLDDQTTHALKARWGAGAGVALAIRVADWLALTAEFAASAALSRSKYQFQRQTLALDPSQVFQVAAGVLVTPGF